MGIFKRILAKFTRNKNATIFSGNLESIPDCVRSTRWRVELIPTANSDWNLWNGVIDDPEVFSFRICKCEWRYTIDGPIVTLIVREMEDNKGIIPAAPNLVGNYQNTVDIKFVDYDWKNGNTISTTKAVNAYLVDAEFNVSYDKVDCLCTKLYFKGTYEV